MHAVSSRGFWLSCNGQLYYYSLRPTFNATPSMSSIDATGTVHYYRLITNMRLMRNDESIFLTSDGNGYVFAGGAAACVVVCTGHVGDCGDIA